MGIAPEAERRARRHRLRAATRSRARLVPEEGWSAGLEGLPVTPELAPHAAKAILQKGFLAASLGQSWSASRRGVSPMHEPERPAGAMPAALCHTEGAL